MKRYNCRRASKEPPYQSRTSASTDLRPRPRSCMSTDLHLYCTFASSLQSSTGDNPEVVELRHWTRLFISRRHRKRHGATQPGINLARPNSEWSGLHSSERHRNSPRTYSDQAAVGPFIKGSFVPLIILIAIMSRLTIILLRSHQLSKGCTLFSLVARCQPVIRKSWVGIKEKTLF